MICNKTHIGDHQFTTINSDWDIDANEANTRVIQGKRMVCVYCGQIRDVFSNGKVVIQSEEGNVTYGNDRKN